MNIYVVFKVLSILCDVVKRCNPLIEYSHLIAVVTVLKIPVLMHVIVDTFIYLCFNIIISFIPLYIYRAGALG